MAVEFIEKTFPKMGRVRAGEKPMPIKVRQIKSGTLGTTEKTLMADLKSLCGGDWSRAARIVEVGANHVMRSESNDDAFLRAARLLQMKGLHMSLSVEELAERLRKV